MKQLTDDLKRILAGLAFQESGEFLTTDQKLDVLGASRGVQGFAVKETSRLVPKRVSVLSNEHGEFRILDQVIDDCRQLHAQLDLLMVNENVNHHKLNTIETTLRCAGIHFQLVALQGQVAEAIAEYIHEHPSVTFLAAEKGNEFIENLVKEVESALGGYLPMPMVYIKEDVVFEPRLMARAV